MSNPRYPGNQQIASPIDTGRARHDLGYGGIDLIIPSGVIDTALGSCYL